MLFPFILISLIVLALAEILGTDVETAVKQAERDRKRQPSTGTAPAKTAVQPDAIEPITTDLTASIERARAVKAEKDAISKAEALDALLRIVGENPDATLSHIGQRIDRSKTTVANYLRELERDGRLQRNGEGWRIRP